MSLTIRVNMGNNIDSTSFFKEKQQGNKNTFFAGDTNLATDPIVQKRKEAQAKAMKIVSDAWNADKEIDKSVKDRKSHYDNMLVQKEEAQAELKKINQEKETLKEQYGITDDSQEQKELEFIEKVEDYLSGDFDNGITAEDLVNYVELSKQPKTEYQKRVLELNEQAKVFKAQIADAEKLMKDDISDMKAIAMERLKSNPMLDAKKSADALLAAANKEIISMAMQEAKEQIDEKMDEAAEQAEEAAEKKEAKEEKLEDIREMKAIQEALIEGTKEAAEKAAAKRQENEAPEIPIDDLIELTQMNSETGKVQKSLENIKYNMNLLEADLKGIEIDKEI